METEGLIYAGTPNRLSKLYSDTKQSYRTAVPRPAVAEDDPAIASLFRKFRIQKDRLIAWGLEWSDSKAVSAEAHIDDSVERAGLTEVVSSIMENIKDILDAVERMKPGAPPAPPDQPSEYLPEKTDPTSQWPDTMMFGDMVNDMTSSIDLLCDLSRSRREAPGHSSKHGTLDDKKQGSALTNQSSDPVDYQNKLNEALQDFEAGLSPTQKIDRSRIIMPEEAPPPYDSFGMPSTVRIVGRLRIRDDLTDSKGNPHLDSTLPVLVEYADFDSCYQDPAFPLPLGRLEHLLQMLGASGVNRPEGLLNLIGYFEDASRPRIGLVYELPHFLRANLPILGQAASTLRPASLYNLLQTASKSQSGQAGYTQPIMPALEERFRLASELIASCAFMFENGFTHRNVSSNNVVFFPDPNQRPTTPISAGPQYAIRKAVLCSFDLFSEFDIDTSPENLHQNIYRHPDDPRVKGPAASADHHPRFDIYSLGLVLLEVGLWVPLADIFKEKYSLKDFSVRLERIYTRRLASKCGSAYMRAVQECLQVGNDAYGSQRNVADVFTRLSASLRRCCLLDDEEQSIGNVPEEVQAVPTGMDVKADPSPEVEEEDDAVVDPAPPGAWPPEPILPDFELSVENPGDRNRYFFGDWDLSQHVRDQWPILSNSLGSIVGRALRKSKESCNIGLCPFGRTASTAKPTFCIQCTSTKRVQRAIQKHFQFDTELFGLIVTKGQTKRSHAVRSSAGVSEQEFVRRSANSKSSLRPAKNPFHHERPICGASIGAWIDNEHLPPVSFGGVVNIDDELYGMTVHHILEDPAEDNAEDCASKDESTSIDDEYDSDDSDSDMDADDWDDANAGDTTGIARDEGEDIIVTQPALVDVAAGFFPREEDRDEDHLDSHTFGHIHASSGLKRISRQGTTHEVDWALLKLHSDRLQTHNLVPGGRPFSRKADLGYKPKLLDPVCRNKYASDQDLYPRNFCKTEEMAGLPVHAFGRTSGLEVGRISQTMRLVRIAGRQNFTQSWTVKGKIGVEGDSGAWIIENEGGRVCGHVLAYSSGQGEAYISPMEVMLDDIRETLQARQVSIQDQVQDICQSIIDHPHTFQYSCFHLEHDNERVPDFIDIGDLSAFSPNAEFTLIEDPYTEKDAKVHILRIRELIGAAGDRIDPVHGIQAGLSKHDLITKSEQDKAPSQAASTTKKDSIPRHPLSGYDLKAPPGFEALLQAETTSQPTPLKSIALSPWNPPPYHLRTKGHLLYLQLVTNEGEQFQITSHVTGFFVNKNSNSKFDPFPRTNPKKYHAHSLLTLLSLLSQSFESSFVALQEFNGQKDPLSMFQPSNAIASSPWIVSQTSATTTSHAPDLCRTQESLLLSGAESSETMRDWNEGFQTTRELPKETVQDRVFRARVASKLFADYNEAATRGAILIARGELTPLNPTEAKDAHIFVYNNVFYSFGVDGVGTFAAEGGDEAARVATGKDVMGVKTVNQLDIQELATPGTVIVDYLGRRIVAQSIVPGIFKQREPGEQQIDYGGVEGRDIVAEHEAFVPHFKTLSSSLRLKRHPVWDKEGKRHDLEASIETKGLLGTDGRKYVLDLYRITPVDVYWLEKYCNTSGKTEAGTEPTAYPHRMVVMRPELVDIYWRHKLRDHVLKTSGMNMNGTTDEKTQETADTKAIAANETDGKVQVDGEGATSDKTDSSEGDTGNSQRALKQLEMSGFEFSLNPDVFSGQTPHTDEEKEAWAADEADVRAVSTYLLDDIIPRLVSDLKGGEVGFPMDGQSLSSLLHSRGINIRYLGHLAQLANVDDARLGALKSLAVQEMISRGFKHVANRYLRVIPSSFANSCISHLLNCLLGAGLNEAPVAETDKDMKRLYPKDAFEYESVTAQRLREQITSQINARYQYVLEPDWSTQIKHVQMLREVALKLGLQLVAKSYQFTRLTDANLSKPVQQNGIAASTSNGHPVANGKKKRKAGDNPSPGGVVSPHITHTQTFQPDDILNIFPIIKEASPRNNLAEETFEAGRLSIAQGQKEVGQELLLESLSLHEQIYGILHPEVARLYYQLSSLFYSLEDKPIAIELAHKAVIVSERTLGIDSAETILAYLNLALLEHAWGNTHQALAYVRHALDLWKVVYGVNHPDSITTLNNIAVMLQHLKLYHESRLWFEASLATCQQITSDNNDVNTGTLLFQLAQALALDSDSKGAVTRMREAYNIFNAKLGHDDRNTKEAEAWLEQLTQNAVSIAKHAKDVQARRLRKFNQLTPRVTIGTRPQPQSGQPSGQTALEMAVAQASAAMGGQPTDRMRLDERSVDELLRYIEGSDAAKSSTPKKRVQHPKRRQQASVAGV
ncbi:MAG: Intracellular distribution of mitochondria [Chrysothrix sp. TS-e1954]|nr:MAG: Intracellular distribution of mitochondria [Chrysothrix sp. TS-e1954]